MKPNISVDSPSNWCEQGEDGKLKWPKDHFGKPFNPSKKLGPRGRSLTLTKSFVDRDFEFPCSISEAKKMTKGLKMLQGSSNWPATNGNWWGAPRQLCSSTAHSHHAVPGGSDLAGEQRAAICGDTVPRGIIAEPVS